MREQVLEVADIRYRLTVSDLELRRTQAAELGVPAEEALVFVEARWTGAPKGDSGWVLDKPVEEITIYCGGAIPHDDPTEGDEQDHDEHRLYYRLGMIGSSQAMQVAVAMAASGQLPAAFAPAAEAGLDNRARRNGTVDELVARLLGDLQPQPEPTVPVRDAAAALVAARTWVETAGTFPDGTPVTTLEREIPEAAAHHGVPPKAVQAELALQAAALASAALAERASAIVAARDAGASLRAIAHRTGLTAESVRQIEIRHRKGPKAVQDGGVRLYDDP